ncbi:nucleotide-binding alpha-beta plait domain-containing protein [Tanacetum coccineum]
MKMYRSKEDELAKLSSSIFVTNFPDKFSAKELWTVCKQYGTVVDAFIPDRRSKAGKRFGFVRFIKIFDVDRLVNNLCTIWVGRFKLHANIARFQRPPLNKNNSQSSHNKGDQSAPKDFYKESGENVNSKSYAHVVNAGPHQFHKKEDSPAIVLDETYANKTDYSLALLGKVKDLLHPQKSGQRSGIVTLGPSPLNEPCPQDQVATPEEGTGSEKRCGNLLPVFCVDKECRLSDYSQHVAWFLPELYIGDQVMYI